MRLLPTFRRIRRGGRPRIDAEIRDLISRMARDNVLWGAPRIHGELLMLGFKVSQATVSRYISQKMCSAKVSGVAEQANRLNVMRSVG